MEGILQAGWSDAEMLQFWMELRRRARCGRRDIPGDSNGLFYISNHC